MHTIKTMRHTKDYLLIILSAFLVAEWNPMLWHITFRGLYVLCIAAVVTFAVTEYKKK